MRLWARPAPRIPGESDSRSIRADAMPATASRHALPVLLLAVVLAATVLSLPALAEKADDVKRQQEDVKKKIEKEKAGLVKTHKIERVTLDQLDEMNRELSRISRDLEKGRQRLAETQAEVRRVEARMGPLKQRIGQRGKWLGRKLRAQHRFGLGGAGGALDLVRALSTADDLSELLRNWTYLMRIAEHEHRALEAYRRDLASLEAARRELQQAYAKHQAETERTGKIADQLKRQREQKASLLESVRRQKSDHQKMLKDLLATSARLDALIKKSQRDDSYGGKGFRARKGRLPWPVEGKVAVPYGTTNDPRFQTPVFRNGIYISAQSGELTRAVHGGKVVYADWFKGYGHLVIINHGEGYHTLYANLSEIFLAQGDIIKDKAKVGLVGEFGMLSSAALYFEIRYNGKALNPSHWLGAR